MNEEILLRIIPKKADKVGLTVGRGVPPAFCVAKIKKENKEKKKEFQSTNH